MHFTPKDWSFAYFKFLGVGKLILEGLSNRRCRWHRRKIYVLCVYFSVINFNFNTTKIPAFGCRWSVFRRCQWYCQSLKIRDKDLSPVSLTPAIKFLPVLMTLLNSLSPVPLTPVINIHSRISPRIFKKFKMAPTEYLGALGALIHEKTWSRKSPCKVSLWG